MDYLVRDMLWPPSLVFRKTKDLYLIITQKLIILKSVKSGGFHHWNLVDFTMKSVKSGRFQVKSTPNLIKSDVSTKTLQFGGGGVHGGGYDPRFHEIQGHSPSPAFIKLNTFCWNIWFYKVFGVFHVKSKDHLQGIVTLCLTLFSFLLHFWKLSSRFSQILDVLISR